MVKTFNIECSMEERWISEFYSFLKELEHNGHIGHSQMVGFYSDGDGDFRPSFKMDKKLERGKDYYYVSSREKDVENLEYYDL